ncbi:MAG: hypothetical protein IPP39_13885 [Chitinophagaceae bacterium]|nr:hypothetical protein [Chitinophagaceae bacterium]
MSVEQFNQLIATVSSLIENELVPAIGNPLPQINLPTNYIRYTFYLLHKTLYTTKSIRESWINFLHDMFCNLKTKGNYQSKISLKNHQCMMLNYSS